MKNIYKKMTLFCNGIGSIVVGAVCAGKSVSAANVDTSKINQGITNISDIFASFGRPLLIVAVIVAAIFLMLFGSDGVRKAKGVILAAIAGVALILYRSEIADLIFSIK